MSNIRITRIKVLLKLSNTDKKIVLLFSYRYYFCIFVHGKELPYEVKGSNRENKGVK